MVLCAREVFFAQFRLSCEQLERFNCSVDGFFRHSGVEFGVGRMLRLLRSGLLSR
jgi:hypothetical protein